MSSREMASLRQRWTAYQDLPTLTEHWYWRPGWHAGRRFYTWHLTFQDQPALHHLITDLQQRLALLPGLDPVPLDGLHLTMQGIGFTDEVPDSDIEAMIAEARRQCGGLRPLELSLGPVDPDAEGIGLLIRPWAAVERVRAAVRASIAAVWPVVPEPADGFRPHLTIAYSGAPAPTAPIRARLAELRHLPPVTATISEVSLIALRREDRTYRWSTVATAPLNG
ncbi:2'-5' RNA ligase family protein [Micromonospora sp. WMMD1082]|uniref:2'-5' RNA ligase family protein n=1 Tax=Micromonospora sp. WMMD1082 TaxID=3016104 RepID=UPI0024179578|nr:2'-5' RNA ligase family protein [Micromonospora sp. WMMD1082]MDG4793035.1 2'-5' RNA ligase family protein [Micromonospora sp. WMMD1082]